MTNTKPPLDMSNEAKIALYEAIEQGDTKALATMIAQGIDIHSRSRKWGLAPLHLAVASGHTEIVQLLLENNVDVDAWDNEKATLLHYAARHDDEERMYEIAKILIVHGAQVNDRDSMGRTPLQDASLHGHCKIIRLLLEHKATVNEGNVFGRTPLHLAATYGHLAAVQLLLEHGALVNEPDRYGITPLHATLKEQSDNYLNVVNLLRTYGAHE